MKRTPVDVTAFTAELDSKARRLRELGDLQAALVDQLMPIELEIETLMHGITHARRSKTRAKNSESLRVVVLRVLKQSGSKGLKLSDLADAVIHTGYKSNSRNFRNVLYQCLYNTPTIQHHEPTGAYRITK